MKTVITIGRQYGSKGHEIGEKIYNRRKELGLTLEQVGDAVGVGKSTVRKWENGMIKNMRRDKIKKLSEVLHVSPGYLMGWTNDPSDYGEEQPTTEEVLSDFERAVLKQLRLLSEDQQQKFLALLTSLISTQEP